MKIRIHVTKEILEKTKMCSPLLGFVSTNCAVAVAVRDIFPSAQVNGIEIDTWMGCLIPLPEAAKEFILIFDMSTSKQREQLNPISFDIDVPESVIERIGITEVERILSESKTLERV